MTTGSGRETLQAQWEHLQMNEWVVNQQRDSCTTYIGHRHMLAYFAVAEGVSIARYRNRFLEKMVDPCGPPPPPAREAFLPKDVVQQLHQRDGIPSQ